MSDLEVKKEEAVQAGPAPKKRRRWTKDDTELTLLAAPTFIWYVLFCYLPMFGVIIAFKNYKITPGASFLTSLLKSDWSGFDNFKYFFGLPGLSGVGISFGADRIYDVLLGLDRFPEELNCSTRAFFVNLGNAEEQASRRLLRAVRNVGIPAEIYPEAAKMKKQLEYANRRGIPHVVIIGSRELEERVATVKHMRTGEQRQISFADLATVLM